MANVEAFCWNFSSSTNPEIERSGFVAVSGKQLTMLFNFDS